MRTGSEIRRFILVVLDGLRPDYGVANRVGRRLDIPAMLSGRSE